MADAAMVPADTRPAEPGWYAGVHDWKGLHLPVPLYWDGQGWGFNGPDAAQSSKAPKAVRYVPRRVLSYGAAALLAYEAEGWPQEAQPA